MKRLIVATITLILAATGLSAQTETPDTLVSVTVDSLAVKYDSYQDITENLGSSLVMSDSLAKAMKFQTEKNKGRRTMGYRVRIYFDNSQNARTVSQSVADTFAKYNPGIPVYRKYDNPYFKVTVGEFYTKSDAMRFIVQIRKKYPSAFLVREPFSTI